MQKEVTTKHLERLRRNRTAKREDAKVAKISPRKPLRTLAFFASLRFGWLDRMHSESSSREPLVTEENPAQKKHLSKDSNTNATKWMPPAGPGLSLYRCQPCNPWFNRLGTPP